jgi:RimJ/RimL family protein N-acetyltransferase
MSQIQPTLRVLKDNQRCTIRSADGADAAGHLQCLRACMEDGEGLVTTPFEKQMLEDAHRQSVEHFAEAANNLLILAECAGTIVGSLDFKGNPKLRLAHTGDFGMALLPAWRGKGIGTALLAELIAWAEAHPTIEKINLRVLSSNARAIGLYRKFGFVEEGICRREIKYEDGSYSDEILLAKFV